MPKRPQVSIRGETFDKVKRHCDEHKLTLKDFIDDLCCAFFAEQAAARRKKRPATKSKKAKAAKKKDADGAGPQKQSKPPVDTSFNLEDFDVKKARF